MEFVNFKGRKITVNPLNYRIDWNSNKVSAPQFKVKRFLFPYWKQHLVLEELAIHVIPGSRDYRFDLVNMTRKIIVEVSPAQHLEYNKFFHKGSKINFANALKRDMDKQRWAEINGFTFVEICDCDMDGLSKEWFLEEYGITL